MATAKQISLNIRRADARIAKLTKEITGLKAKKVKLAAALKSAPKAGKKSSAKKSPKRKSR
jgi:hypothetical protein